MTRVLFLQYTNPAGYPPLEHAAGLLAEAGADVYVLGTTAVGTDALRWPPRNRVTLSTVPVRSRGLRQKVDYLRYMLRAVTTAAQLRPDWLYVSDTLAAPIALAVRRLMGSRLVYHEHDEPVVRHPSRFLRWCLGERQRLARVAEEVVVPNRSRAIRLASATGRQQPIRTVWNCPRSTDVGPSLSSPYGPLRVVYQGSITPARVPLPLIRALASVGEAELVVIGYETIGSRGHIQALMDEASQLGIRDRITVMGTIPLRSEMLHVTATCHVGLSLLPRETDDANEANMVGASNKAFDYMARGLGLIVTDRPEWEETFVRNGYARACNPDDPESIAEAISWYAARRARMDELGDRARAKIEREWNYEAQFGGVLQTMLGRD